MDGLRVVPPDVRKEPEPQRDEEQHGAPQDQKAQQLHAPNAVGHYAVRNKWRRYHGPKVIATTRTHSPRGDGDPSAEAVENLYITSPPASRIAAPRAPRPRCGRAHRLLRSSGRLRALARRYRSSSRLSGTCAGRLHERRSGASVHFGHWGDAPHWRRDVNPRHRTRIS